MLSYIDGCRSDDIQFDISTPIYKKNKERQTGYKTNITDIGSRSVSTIETDVQIGLSSLKGMKNKLQYIRHYDTILTIIGMT